MFAALGREMPLNNLKQALIPSGATIISTAWAPPPAIASSTTGGSASCCPGVPREMKPMMEETVLPWLRSLRGPRPGLPARGPSRPSASTESGLDEMVAGAIDPSEGRVSFRASFPEVSLRVVVHGTAREAAARLEVLAPRIRERIGDFVYGEGAVNMEEVAGRLLRERGLTLGARRVVHRRAGRPSHHATCRAARRTSAAGCVAYANEAKEALLGVRRRDVAAHGAVSEETAAEMAAGVSTTLARRSGCRITGIAGPDGGSAEKPVGTACFGLASERASSRGATSSGARATG